MDFNEYQEKAKGTAKYREEIIYPVLGLCSEAGEVADKVKKVLRDNDGVFSDEKKNEIVKEIGDVLWYISAIATDLKIDLNKVALLNLDKLSSRKERNVISGSGDNR